jgi:hypothetical protein
MYYKIFKAGIVLYLICTAFILKAQDKCTDNCGCGMTDLSPPGLMYNKLHRGAEWMISYDYSHTGIQGNICGDSKIGSDEIRKSYIMAPDKMVMDMHMLMAMYGVTDRFTIMLMTSWNTSTMNMNMNGTTIMNMPGMPAEAAMPDRQTISGWGDSKITALYSIFNKENDQVTAGLGISIPTGSVNKKAFEDLYPDVHADYNMQTGTGSIDFSPSISYRHHSDVMDEGIEAEGIIRPFNNSNRYHFENEAALNLWVARKWNPWLSNSIRAGVSALQGIQGWDSKIYAMMEPASDATNYGGFKCTMYPGVNFYPRLFPSHELNFRIEYGFPVYQHVNGIQIQERSDILARLEFLF